jgi:hypothetical protein
VLIDQINSIGRLIFDEHRFLIKLIGEHRSEHQQHPGRKANGFDTETGFVKNGATLRAVTSAKEPAE